jgi:hypothetical protein
MGTRSWARPDWHPRCNTILVVEHHKRGLGPVVIWMLDPSALVPAKVAQTLLLLVRSRGAYDVNDSSGTRLGRIRPLGGDAAATGDRSTFLASNAAVVTRCDLITCLRGFGLGQLHVWV